MDVERRRKARSISWPGSGTTPGMTPTRRSSRLNSRDCARCRTSRSASRPAFSHLRVVGPVGAPVGLSVVKGDELYQLFVSAQSRGTGVAAALIADAQARLSARGVETAWLTCAIGNDRAAILRAVGGAGSASSLASSNTGWHLSAGSLRTKNPCASLFSTPNVNTVLDANVSPGRSIVDGNAG